MALATQANLEAAETAYFKLLTGATVAKFRDQNGEEVTYPATKAADLRALINLIRAELGLPALGYTGFTGPAKLWFA